MFVVDKMSVGDLTDFISKGVIFCSISKMPMHFAFIFFVSANLARTFFGGKFMHVIERSLYLN